MKQCLPCVICPSSNVRAAGPDIVCAADIVHTSGVDFVRRSRISFPLLLPSEIHACIGKDYFPMPALFDSFWYWKRYPIRSNRRSRISFPLLLPAEIHACIGKDYFPMPALFDSFWYWKRYPILRIGRYLLRWSRRYRHFVPTISSLREDSDLIRSNRLLIQRPPCPGNIGQHKRNQEGDHRHRLEREETG